MTRPDPDDLWRDFPKTATEFEERFASEEDCRAYWIEARWGGRPTCARCNSTRLWSERGGTLFECADCGHQTSLTSGTILEKNEKAAQDVVPRGVRDFYPPNGHLGQGSAAHHGVRFLQNSVELAAQTARRAAAGGG